LNRGFENGLAPRSDRSDRARGEATFFEKVACPPFTLSQKLFDRVCQVWLKSDIKKLDGNREDADKSLVSQKKS
jgi:hypothetical protein